MMLLFLLPVVLVWWESGRAMVTQMVPQILSVRRGLLAVIALMAAVAAAVAVRMNPIANDQDMMVLTMKPYACNADLACAGHAW